ncbi:DNA-binding domain-containing protein [Gallibacterium trehalosifermentans]|uniref:DNA-binding domain-containing protein n=1 Tax=Gallibacterium trehalosifermentans TaxID=516935 RepID=A0ABV6GZQ7_9PAST
MKQTAFVEAIFHDDLSFLPQIKSREGIDVKSRFNVYRNNIFSSLMKALQITFNVTHQLVGDDFFQAMAHCYLQESPPTSPILAYYGDTFPKFIAHFTPAKSLPYLADVATLEYLRVQSFHAEDSKPIANEQLIALLQNNEIANYQLQLAPSLLLFSANYAAVSLWEAHQIRKDLQKITLEQREYAAILRENYEVGVLQIPQWLHSFLMAIKQGKTLYQATVEIDPFTEADLTQAWQFLIENKLIIGVKQ